MTSHTVPAHATINYLYRRECHEVVLVHVVFESIATTLHVDIGYSYHSNHPACLFILNDILESLNILLRNTSRGAQLNCEFQFTVLHYKHDLEFELILALKYILIVTLKYLVHVTGQCAHTCKLVVFL